MPKKIFDDVLRLKPRGSSKPKGFLARVAARKVHERGAAEASEEEETESVVVHHRRTSLPHVESSTESHRRSSWTTIFLWILGILVAVLAIYFISALLSRAQIEVQPRQEPVVMNASLTAVSPEEEGPLHFQIMELSGDASVSIPATGRETVNKKASGTVVLYNAYSSKAQKLVASTRLKASNGKIYRIPAAVTIPGAETQAGALVPGSL